MGRIERRVEREVSGFAGSAIKLLVGAAVLLWPIALIDESVFKHANWWQWALGGLAEAVWLAIVLVLWAASQRDKH